MENINNIENFIDKNKFMNDETRSNSTDVLIEDTAMNENLCTHIETYERFYECI